MAKDIHPADPQTLDRGLTVSRRFLARQNPHSLFIAGAGVLLFVTLVLDLIVHPDTVDAWLTIVLLLVCVFLCTVALWRGHKFPFWAGQTSIGIFFVATLYYISPLTSSEYSVASAQELPIIALYFGWFVPPLIGRIVMVAGTSLLIVIVASNPDFARHGEIGLPTAVQMFVVVAFCYEAGSLLWRESRKRVVTDQLTGAFNRAGFLERLKLVLNSSLRTGVPMCLVVIDFDYFKQLNDTYGHAAGDKALQDTVDYWNQRLRSGDVLGRTGGDEFAIVLNHSDATTTQQVMKRLRAGSPHPWTWGIAQARFGDDAETIFERADSQLYRRKRSRDATAQK